MKQEGVRRAATTAAVTAAIVAGIANMPTGTAPSAFARPTPHAAAVSRAAPRPAPRSSRPPLPASGERVGVRGQRPRNAALPADEAGAKGALEESSRHGEYVDISVSGRTTPLNAFVVYPERKDKAPIVIVIHEIYGLTDWIRGVADQLAREGFIAIAPDLLSGKGPNSGGTAALGSRDEVTKAVRSLTRDEIAAALNATRAYGVKIPAANGRSATVGFCFGGATSFWYAAATPDLNAAVVYYGGSPEAAALATIKAPVLGLYGGEDARVNTTIEPAAAEMKKLGRTYTTHIYPGAGHGFLRQQTGMEGANLKATEQAWPATLAFLREHTK